MRKLILKDKNRRNNIKIIENYYYILKYIFKNFNFFLLIRWNAFLKLKYLTKNYSKVSVIHKCLYSLNKKRFNKLTVFGRHLFLKLIRSGLITGMQKSSW